MKALIFLLLTSGTLRAAVPGWPQFRGPNASGVSEDARSPVRFGPGSNQLWKVTVPRGISSPVVWGDHLFLTAVENFRLLTLPCDALDVVAVNRLSENVRGTPAIAGQRIYVRGAEHLWAFGE